ncbi:unnamed protein product, partial [Trichobilharzia regenti]
FSQANILSFTVYFLTEYKKKSKEATDQTDLQLKTVRKKKKHLKNCNALNLIQRGLIPPNAQIAFDPSPIQTKPMNILLTSQQKITRLPITINGNLLISNTYVYI